MQDFNCSAIWVLPLLLVPGAYNDAKLFLGIKLPASVALLACPVGFATAIGFILFNGDRGPNHFGPDPVAAG